MPPPLPRDSTVMRNGGMTKTDHNNNGGASTENNSDEDNGSSDEDGRDSRDHELRGAAKWRDIAGTYFRRNRIDELLAHAREAKTFGKYACSRFSW